MHTMFFRQPRLVALTISCNTDHGGRLRGESTVQAFGTGFALAVKIVEHGSLNCGFVFVAMIVRRDGDGCQANECQHNQ